MIGAARRRAMGVVPVALLVVVSTSVSVSASAVVDATVAVGTPTRYEVGAAFSGGPEASTIGRRINEAGGMTGWARNPPAAYRWTGDGNPDVLPGIDGAQTTVGYDINDGGVVVGQSGQQAFEPPQRAVRWVDGAPDDLGSLQQGGDSQASGVNEAGTIVGWSTSGFYTHAFVWTETTGMRDITSSGFGWATDVNESGEVTGNQNSRAYVWSDGTLTYLGEPADFPHSFGRAINDLGQVAGGISSASGDAERFTRWTPGVGIEVLGGGGEHNTMLGINNDGTSVGEGRLVGGPLRGFVYADAYGLWDLNDLVNTDEWDIMSAYDINDAGQIVANGMNRFTGVMSTLRLDPITGPLMHDENLRLAFQERAATVAISTARVLDESGDPVRRAKITGAWYDGKELLSSDAVDRTNRRGRAVLRHDVAAAEGISFCVTTVTHRNYTYVPSDIGPPPCATALEELGP